MPAVHGIAMHGDPALPADFQALPYANPDAPKGGTVTYGVQGSFDSLNQFIVQGGTSSARGIRDPEYGELVIESLLARNHDEAFSLYGLLAKSVRLPDERDWIEFKLDERARFSDGAPVTPEDVIFSFEILRDKGRPHFRARYSRIKSMEKIGENTVRFTFENGEDRELPLLVGLSPIFPKHTIDPETFEKSTLVAPVGSGPYVIDTVEPGSRITYRRDPDYWAKDLPIRRGLYNFDEVRVEYFRDENSLQQAFQKGLVSLLPVRDPARWMTGFDFPAVKEGKVSRDSFKLGTPAGMKGFAFNTRRAVFQDIAVRKALAMLFDFEWVNRNLYYGLYERTGGYFDNSILSSLGRPASDAERELLAPYADQIEPDVMAGTWAPKQTDGSGRDRAVLREAVRLLNSAGYAIEDGVMRDRSGRPLTFEFLVASKDEERLAIAYQRQLKLIGVEMTLRSVDAAQYQKRRQDYDFDVVVASWPASLSPGNEQSYRWGSKAADLPGTFNFAGVKSPAVDAMIDALLAARSQEDFVAAVRALDRSLISGHYVVPLFHLPDIWIARWTTIGHPANATIAGPRLEAWWAMPN
nr:extracellular solute-binding protein [Stappia albiluteola]